MINFAGESLQEEKERLLGLAVNFGLIKIKHFPHEPARMVGFTEQFRSHLSSYLKVMAVKGERRIDEIEWYLVGGPNA